MRTFSVPYKYSQNFFQLRGVSQSHGQDGPFCGYPWNEMDHFSIYKLISLAYRTPTDLNILSFLFITVFIIIHMATLQKEFVSLQKNEKSGLVLIGFS